MFTLFVAPWYTRPKLSTARSSTWIGIWRHALAVAAKPTICFGLAVASFVRFAPVSTTGSAGRLTATASATPLDTVVVMTAVIATSPANAPQVLRIAGFLSLSVAFDQ